MGSLMKSNRSRVVLRVCASLVVAFFLYSVRGILAPFIVAAVLAYLLEPPTRLLVRHGFRRPGAVTLIYVVSFLLASVAVLRAIPEVLGELQRFAEASPELVDELRVLARRFDAFYARASLPPAVRAVIDDSLANLETALVASVRSAIEGLLTKLGDLASLLISPVLAFYILRDYDRMRKSALASLPEGESGQWAGLLHRIDVALNRFLRGQALLALIVGTLVTVFAALVGLRFAVLLGLLAAMGEFVPYFGPLFAATPAIVFSLARSLVYGVEVAAGFAIIQQIESAVFGPRILGESVGLHPVLVIFVLFSGGYLFGFWGFFFAVPVFVIGRIFLSFFYDQYF